MKLRDWRKENDLTQAQVADKLAKIIGGTVTHDQISRIENGQAPSLQLAIAIGKLTDDAVAPSDLSRAA